MVRSTIVFVVICTILVTLIIESEAQLNFSTGWGKRSRNSGLSLDVDVNDGAKCKVSVDSLMQIYKLIQMEAQKLLNCEAK
ncbi:hypertrehalosaemic prohormone-like [Chrysoperla carnea]|uniref:hypertrehalosaemic prohormone-like n=1 Tax=Chrysoperla carnea TaxID=189513 RepID=UPI001D063D33|nr:hypertrehalosaemic prohormone-like [Chrysoperla carnea]